MLRLVLFDMDDVLCHYDWRSRVTALSRLSGRSFADLEAAIWNSGFEDASDAGQIDADAYLEGFEARLGIPFTRDAWVANRRAAMTPWPDMLELAKAISSHACVAILTNNGHLTGEHIDALFPELRPVFGERICVSAQFRTQKPDPDVYRRALAHLCFEPHETLFTDDKPENVEGAIAAGLHGHVHAGAVALRARLAQSGLPKLM